MLFLTRMFGVTGSDAERDFATEKSVIEQIVEKVLLLQANAAAQQERPLGRGTHVKGTAARAQFEVLDVTAGRDPVLAARLARGIFAKPGVYPAIVRFGNADSKVNSDFKADVRSLSFSVDLTRDGAVVPEKSLTRQDFSLQNARTLPINDAPGFLAIMKLLTASNPVSGLWSLSLKGQIASHEDSCIGGSTSPPEKAAVSEAALLEQRAVLPRTKRHCETVGNALLWQPRPTTAKKQPERLAGRIEPAPKRRRQDERLRFCFAIPRRREHDLLGQKSGR